MYSRKRLFFYAVVLVVFTAIISSAVTMMLMRYDSGSMAAAQNYAKLYEVIKKVEENFYQPVTESELFTRALKGVVSGLDPYSEYLTAEEYRNLTRKNSGNFVGVGIVIQKDTAANQCVVKQVYEKSPAEAAGIKENDVIVAVDGQDVTGYSTDAIAAMVRGEEGTKVRLTVLRQDERISFTITRAEVEIIPVNSRMIDGVCYIQITTFNANASAGFEDALEYAKKNNAEALLIDVRNNLGGLLNEVVEICDMLLPEGKIVYTIDRKGNEEAFYSDRASVGLPMALLVNGSSASASEILAGALKDFEAATLIGTKTFGKGVVQTLFPLSGDTCVRITTSTYYTPSGYSIHGNGVMPDIEIDLPQELKQNPAAITDENDVQLQKALAVLRGE